MNRSDLFAMCAGQDRTACRDTLHSYFYNDKAMKEVMLGARVYKSDGSSRSMEIGEAIEYLLEEVYGGTD